MASAESYREISAFWGLHVHSLFETFVLLSWLELKSLQLNYWSIWDCIHIEGTSPPKTTVFRFPTRAIDFHFSISSICKPLSLWHWLNLKSDIFNSASPSNWKLTSNCCCCSALTRVEVDEPSRTGYSLATGNSKYGTHISKKCSQVLSKAVAGKLAFI